MNQFQKNFEICFFVFFPLKPFSKKPVSFHILYFWPLVPTILKKSTNYCMFFDFFVILWFQICGIVTHGFFRCLWGLSVAETHRKQPKTCGTRSTYSAEHFETLASSWRGQLNTSWPPQNGSLKRQKRWFLAFPQAKSVYKCVFFVPNAGQIVIKLAPLFWASQKNIPS